MPGAIRHVDEIKKQIKLEFTDGSTFGPIELTPTTNVLTKMIGTLEGRLASVENKTSHLAHNR